MKTVVIIVVLVLIVIMIVFMLLLVMISMHKMELFKEMDDSDEPNDITIEIDDDNLNIKDW